MLTENQKKYLNGYKLLEGANEQETLQLMDRMDSLYSEFSWSDANEIEQWINDYENGRDTLDISGLGYDV
jgi:hypothetical protein